MRVEKKTNNWVRETILLGTWIVLAAITIISVENSPFARLALFIAISAWFGGIITDRLFVSVQSYDKDDEDRKPKS